MLARAIESDALILFRRTKGVDGDESRAKENSRTLLRQVLLGSHSLVEQSFSLKPPANSPVPRRAANRHPDRNLCHADCEHSHIGEWPAQDGGGLNRGNGVRRIGNQAAICELQMANRVSGKVERGCCGSERYIDHLLVSIPLKASGVWRTKNFGGSIAQRDGRYQGGDL